MKKIHHNQGFSLLEILVAMGVFGVLAFASLEVINNSNRATMSVEIRRDRNEIANLISSTIDCKKTLDKKIYGDPPNCNGQLIDLINVSGQKIISAPSSTISRFEVRAKCESNHIDVQVARKKGAQFLADPFNNQLMNWEHPRKSLFPGVGLCQGMFTNTNLRILNGWLLAARDEVISGTGKTGIIPSTANQPWSKAIIAPWPVKSVLATVDGSHSTNSFYLCTVDQKKTKIDGSKVTFYGDWHHGEHKHPVQCVINYVIAGE